MSVNNNIMYNLNLNIEFLDENSKKLEKENKKIDKDVYLVKKEKSFYTEKSQANISQRNNEELLFHIRKKDNVYKLESPVPKKNIFQTDILINNLDNKLWFILNSENIKKREHPLFENDIIRLGKLKYIIHEIHFNSDVSDIENRNEINDYDDVNADSEEIFIKNPEIKKYKNSKFCNSIHICLCDCDNLIHYKCMEKYINEKVKITQNGKKTVKCYSIDNFNCKQCFTPYPIKFFLEKTKETKYVIPYEIPNKNSNYIILESLGHKKDKNTTKTLYVITLDKDIIRIGRNSNNDIIIDDDSIGEERHAVIKFEKKYNRIILKSVDNEYETAVLIKKSLKMNEKKIYLQTGKTKFEANLNEI